VNSDQVTLIDNVYCGVFKDFLRVLKVFFYFLYKENIKLPHSNSDQVTLIDNANCLILKNFFKGF